MLGGGEVTNSQLFPFNGSAGPLTLSPSNGEGFCLFVDGDFVNIDSCREGAAEQTFTFGDGGAGNGSDEPPVVDQPVDETPSAPTPTPTGAAPSDDADAPAVTAPPSGIPAENPTEPVPVSRAGGVLNPEDAAEAHTPDPTATKAREGVSLRASGGDLCLSVDPTAGDFRQNLIPVAVVACDGSPNQQFDIVTGGIHNNGE